MTANQLTAVAAVALVAMGGFALYYNSDSARQDRYDADAGNRFSRSNEGVMASYVSGLQFDSAMANNVRLLDSTAAKRCRSLGHLETQGDVMDFTQGVREIRLRRMATEKGADAIVITTPRQWPARVSGEAYRCGK